MSQITQSLEGQVAPSKLDFLWQKYRNFIFASLAAVAAGVAIVYAFEVAAQAREDARWSKFAEELGLAAGYAEDGSLASFLDQQGDRRGQMVGWYIASTRGELVSQLPEDLEALDTSELAAHAKAADSAVAPLYLFVLARRYAVAEEFDEALATLDSLEKDYPGHFLNQTTDYPPQWRRPVENDEDEVESAPGADEPELEDAVSGSWVARLREQVQTELAFHKSHNGFFECPEPDSDKIATINFGDGREVKVRFYAKAGKHVDRFVQLANDEKFWDGVRIHKIVRTPEGVAQGERGELYFGLAASKDDDRSQWVDAAKPSTDSIVEWEETGISNFPGVLAAEPATDGMSQVEKLVLTTEDMAATKDGSRVVFGKVIEGLDVVRDLVGEPFTDEQERIRGEGRPEINITVESLRVE